MAHKADLSMPTSHQTFFEYSVDMLSFEFKFKAWNWSYQKDLFLCNKTGAINREKFRAIISCAILNDIFSRAKQDMTFKQTFTECLDDGILFKTNLKALN